MSSVTSQQQHWDIARHLKQFREEAGKTQEQLAQELNASDSLKRDRRTISRFAINRIEKGHASLRPFLAGALDAYAEENGRASPGFAYLVANLRTHETSRERGNQLDMLLRSRNYSRLIVVICDVFNFARHLRVAFPTPELHLTVIVPSRDRVFELFGGTSANGDTRVELFDGYASKLNQHIDEQLQLIYGVCGRAREVQLEVLESSTVLNSIVLTKGDRDTRCIYWPCAPFGSMQFEPNLVPIVDDAAVSAWYESLLLGMIRRTSATCQLHLGDVFLASDGDTPHEGFKRAPVSGTVFSRFYPRKVSGHETVRHREGAAVALILPYVPTVRAGEQDVQILLQWRSPRFADEAIGASGQQAFIATRVLNSMAWRAIDDVDGSDDSSNAQDDGSVRCQRSTVRRNMLVDLEGQSQRALKAIRGQVHDSVRPSANSGQEAIIDRAFASAVHEHLRLTYGIDCQNAVSNDKMESTQIMNIRVAKSYGARIVTRLFLVRLDAGERDIMIHNADLYSDTEIQAFGIDEMLEILTTHDRSSEPGQYNDCLGLAIENDELNEEFTSLIATLRDRWVPS